MGDKLMKALVEIEFLNINGTPVNNNLLKQVPMLIASTDKTTKILCEQIEKFFNEQKIKVKATYKIK